MSTHATVHAILRAALLLVADSLEKLAHRLDLNTDAAANGHREVLEALGENNRLIAKLLATVENEREDAAQFQAATSKRLGDIERKVGLG